MAETLSECSHTPGPWELSHALHRDEQYTIGIRGTSIGTYVIASVDYGYTEPFEAQQHANARLIASAPELLFALKALVAWQAEIKHAVPLSYLDGAKAAIAKAEGES